MSERRRVWLNAHVSTTPYPRKVHAYLSGVGYFCDPAARPRRWPAVSCSVKCDTCAVLVVSLVCVFSVLSVFFPSIASRSTAMYSSGSCARAVRAICSAPSQFSRHAPPTRRVRRLQRAPRGRGNSGRALAQTRAQTRRQISQLHKIASTIAHACSHCIIHSGTLLIHQKISIAASAFLASHVESAVPRRGESIGHTEGST